MPWFLTEKNPCGHSQVPGSLRKNRDPDDQHSSLISRPSGHGPNGGTALGSSELKPVDICGSMMKSRTIHLYFYPLVMTFTVRHGKIPTMLLIGKHHLFLWAIYTMAMLVITRGLIRKSSCLLSLISGLSKHQNIAISRNPVKISSLHQVTFFFRGGSGLSSFFIFRQLILLPM